MVDTLSKITARQRQQAVKTGAISPDVKFAYSVVIFNVAKEEIVADTRLTIEGTDRSSNAEYFFTTPPKVEELKEPFSTSIIATQAGGKFIESHGSIIKNLMISGTTGIRPNPVRSSVGNLLGTPIENTPVLGSAVSQLTSAASSLAAGLTLASDKGIPINELSGFDDFHTLQKIFRLYSDIKEAGHTPSTVIKGYGPARHIVMLWRNIKDSDYWIVEPGEFNKSRSAASPMSYDYSISLSTMGRYELAVNVPDDPLKSIKDSQTFFARLQQVSQSIKQMFLILSNQISRLEGAGIFATNTLLKPIINILQGIALVKTSVDQFGEKLVQACDDLIESADAALVVLEGDDRFEPQDVAKRTIRKVRLDTVRLKTMPEIARSVASSVKVLKSSLTKSYTSSSEANTSSTSFGSKTFIGNESETSSVAQAIVNVGDDIRSLAGRIFGDKSRWQILVLYNDLQSPYISTTGEPGTLAPGEYILYPTEGDESSSNQVLKESVSQGVSGAYSGTGTIEGEQLGPIARSYGVDLKVANSKKFGGKTDLVISTVKNDIELITGVNNVVQALQSKFKTKQGELLNHSSYGLNVSIGDRATSVSLNETVIKTTALINSDSRVKSVDKVALNSIGDVVSVSASLTLRGANTSHSTVLES